MPSGVSTVLFFFRRYRRRTLGIVVLLILSGLLESVGILTLLPLLQGLSGTSGGLAGTPLAGVIASAPPVPVLLLLIVLAVALKAVFRFWAMERAGDAMTRVAADLRGEVARGVAAARWSYFVHQPVGRLVDTLSSQTIGAAGAYRAACGVMAEGVQVLCYLLVAAILSPKLALLAPLAAAALFLAMRGLMGRVREASRGYAALTQSLAARLADGLQGFKPLKAMGQEPAFVRDLSAITEELRVQERKQWLAVTAIGLLQEPLFAALLCLALFLATQFLSVPFTALVVIGVLCYRAVTRIGALQTLYAGFLKSEAVFLSLRRTLDAIEAEREPRGGTAQPTLARAIELRAVSFGYDPDRPVLENVDLRIAAGSFVALMGPSGAGKTTLADLVLGLYAPGRGAVLLDGVDLRTIDLAAWRRSVGYVPQDVVLFNDSLFANVALGDETVSRETAAAALDAAGLGAFVASLPDGLDAPLGERGARLSGGQRQRVAIARALARKPRLVIFDEATSALDGVSQEQVRRTVEGLAGRGLTILAISHQASAVAGADAIYEVSGGAVQPLRAAARASVA